MSDLRKLAEAATPGPWRIAEPGANQFEITRVGEKHPLAVVAGEPGVDPWRLPTSNVMSDVAFIAAANPTIILALLDRAERAERERDAAFDRGRATGRRDVGKYSRALGEIEAALGIVGALPMDATVEAVRLLVKDRDDARAEVDRWRAEAERMTRDRDSYANSGFEGQLSEARAEVERLRAVARAAVAWEEANLDDDAAECDALTAAVRKLKGKP